MHPPIRALAVDVLGIHPQNAGMLIVTVSLDARPPLSWRRHFLDACRSLPHDPAHEPLVEGDCIYITPRDARLEEEVAQVVQAIAQANARERAGWLGLPTPDEEGVRDPRVLVHEALTAETRLRIAQARRRASGLSDEFKHAQECTPLRPDSDG